jgi:hypothetical protein
MASLFLLTYGFFFLVPGLLLALRVFFVLFGCLSALWLFLDFDKVHVVIRLLVDGRSLVDLDYLASDAASDLRPIVLFVLVFQIVFVDPPLIYSNENQIQLIWFWLIEQE